MWKLAFVLLALTCCCFANNSDCDNNDYGNVGNGGSVRPVPVVRPVPPIQPVISVPVRPVTPVMPPVVVPAAVPNKQDIVKMMAKHKDGHIQGQVYNYATHEETKNGVETVHSKGDLIKYHDGVINEKKFAN